MPRDILLLDVDNTLYARSCGVVERIDRLIDRYVIERMGVDPSAVGEVRRELRREHGTTLRALMHRHAIDPDEYLRFVHAVEVAELLAPDPALAAMAGPHPAAEDGGHNGTPARTPTAVLDCSGCAPPSPRVYALEELAYVPKPAPEAFAAVLADLGARAPDCILVEDSIPNLATARGLGMRTVHVAEDAQPEVADVVIPSIHHLESALARLVA